MGFRFRRSFKIAPGVRVNLGKKSAGISVGVRGARISTNTSTGTRATVGIPGTGLSYSQKINPKTSTNLSPIPNSEQPVTVNISQPENKCPLCNKLNPASEWVCEDCGAQLPRNGISSPRSEPPTATATPQKNYGKSCLLGCGALFVLFVLLPASCSLRREPEKTEPAIIPTPAPLSAPLQQQPHQSLRVWVNKGTGVYHRPGSRWYGNTVNGEYMTEEDALRLGYRAARG